jgi:hypothetical protein
MTDNQGYTRFLSQTRHVNEVPKGKKKISSRKKQERALVVKYMAKYKIQAYPYLALTR